MKTKKIILAIIFLSLAVITNAQPLPPTTPEGNPIPIEGLISILLMALMAFGIIRLRNKNK